MDRHFWRPLELVDADRLFTAQIQNQDGRSSPLSHPEYLHLRDVGAEAGFPLATFGPLDVTLVADGNPTRANVALVSGNFFTVLGIRPAYGRLLTPLDDGPGSGAAVAVVVSRRAWTTRFGRDPELVGRNVRLGPQAFTVVGVAANPLLGPGHNPDFWVPLSAIRQLLPNGADFLLGPAARWLYTVGRLQASTSRSDAAALGAVAQGRLPADVAAARTENWRVRSASGQLCPARARVLRGNNAVPDHPGRGHGCLPLCRLQQHGSVAADAWYRAVARASGAACIGSIANGPRPAVRRRATSAGRWWRAGGATGATVGGSGRVGAAAIGTARDVCGPGG